MRKHLQITLTFFYFIFFSFIPLQVYAAQTANGLSIRADTAPKLSKPELAFINLGSAGLLRPFFSNEQYALLGLRLGQERYAYSAKQSRPELTDFEDETQTLVAPAAITKKIPGDRFGGYIRLGYGYVDFTSAPNAVDMKGTDSRVDLQYLLFPTTNQMVSIGLVYENLNSFDNNNDIKTDRDSAGLRFDYLSKFSKHWGLTSRVEYTWGDAVVEAYGLATPSGPATLEHDQDDDRLYLEANIVGTYDRASSDWIPNGWVVHPSVGANYLESYLESTHVTVGDTVLPKQAGIRGEGSDHLGRVFSHILVGKKLTGDPGLQFIPNIAAGVEYSYSNNLDGLNDESTYVAASAGLASVYRGQALNLAYSRHQGVDGKRSSDFFLISIALSF